MWKPWLQISSWEDVLVLQARRDPLILFTLSGNVVLLFYPLTQLWILNNILKEVAIMLMMALSWRWPMLSLGPQNNPVPLISLFSSTYVPISPSNQVSLCAIKIRQRGRIPRDGPSQVLQNISPGPSFKTRGSKARWLRMWARVRLTSFLPQLTDDYLNHHWLNCLISFRPSCLLF